MLDAIVTVLVDKLVYTLLNEGHLVLQFHKHFKAIKEELLLLQSYLKDFDRVRIKERKEIQKTVIKGLRELLYDIEDVIVDCKLFSKRQRRRRASKYISYCFPAYLKLRHRIGNQLQEINQEIKNHRERMAAYLSTLPNKEHVRNNQREIYPVLTNDDDIVGLDNDAHKIKQWILEAHGPLTIIAIVGMGGTGKTTLAEKIINDSSVKEYFDRVFIVVVSQNFDFAELVKGILRKLHVDDRLLKGDIRDLLQELQNKLAQNKHLIILDDVWEVDDGRWWKSLKSAFPQTIQNNGTCVIVTTRHKEVAQKMGAYYTHNPKTLSENDSWSLFSKIAFAREGGRCPNSHLESIGRDVITKCGGLPLAIKVVAGLMNQLCLCKGDSVDEWKRIKQRFETDENYEPVMPMLELSYEELPVNLKPCLLCFAAFPEDCMISIEDVIFWWIGEGFVQGNYRRTAFEIGKEYFNELIGRCLLLGVDKDVFDRSSYRCRVHDMVRDMILKIAKEENFMSFAQSCGDLPSAISSRRVNLPSNMSTDLFGSTNSKTLRTITGVKVHESLVCGLHLGLKLSEMKWLRVLNISFKTDEVQPWNARPFNWLHGFQSVPHIVCLRIQNSTLDELPDFFGILHNLQILDLRGCGNLKKLPDSVTSLDKLTILCVAVEYLPIGIGKLPSLQRLIGFKPASSAIKDGCCISCLKTLAQLQYLMLEISTDNQIQAGDMNVLPELKQLKRLIIYMDDGISETIIPRVDCELAPFQQLEELNLLYYKGERTPTWLNPTCLPNLRFLEISFGNITHINPRFFGTTQRSEFLQLEGLALRYLDHLEELEWPSMQMALPSLGLLKICGCDTLKSLPCNMVTSDFGRIWRKKGEVNREMTGTS